MTPAAIILLILLTLLLLGIIGLWQARTRQHEAARQQIVDLKDRLLDTQAELGQTTALQTLSEAAYDALILIDQEHRIVTMNQPARLLFGYTEPLPPAPTGTLIAITRNHEIDALVTEVLDSGEALSLQLTLGERAYRLQTRYIQIEQGAYVGLALEDVSELQRLGRARRDMVANVSHELRTPITSIRLLTDTLLREDPPGKKQRNSILHKIVAETDTLQQMAQELLDLSMIESGRAEFILKTVSLRKIVTRAVEHYSEQARREAIRLTVDLPRGLKVLADAGQIERVMGNLLHNAIKFTPAEGSIVIDVPSTDGEWVTVAVTDSGPGIATEDRTRIFERFYRSDQARRGGGTGLGLAIAKHIVRAHGGTIWADAPPTPGARICFTLPLPEEVEEKSTEETSGAQ